MAAVMDRVSLVRSIVGLRDEHSSFQNLTGYTMGVAQREGRPSFGSVISRLAGQVDPIVPAVRRLVPHDAAQALQQPRAGHAGSCGGRCQGRRRRPGQHEAALRIEIKNSPSDENCWRISITSAARSTAPASICSDAAYRRAFDVLTSSKLVDAMDVEKEDPAVRERYGRGSAKHLGDGGPMWNDQLLMARRLVEAGARCVTVAYGFWDTHGNNFGWLKERLPLFDQGISALVEDIYQRGLDRDVTRGRVGRVWPHAEDQQGRRPRPLGAGQLCAAVRRRHAHRPGDRRHG